MRSLELRSCGEALASYLNQGNKWIAPALYGLLAELEAVSRGPDSALTLIDQGLAIAGETDEHFSDPYLHRATRRHPAEAQSRRSRTRRRSLSDCNRGRETAGRAQLTSCSRLFRSPSSTNRPARPADAHAVLAPALEGFSPTPEMPEIAEAQALLTALAADRRGQGDSRAAAATDAIARRLRQRAHRGARLSARRKRRKRSPEPASRRLATRMRRSGWRPTTVCGRAATCEASCRRCGRTPRPYSATSRRDPIRPRPASPIAPPGSDAGSPASIARRGITSKGRSPCSNPAATTIWPFASDTTPASPRWPIWRWRRGLSAKSIARFR